MKQGKYEIFYIDRHGTIKPVGPYPKIYNTRKEAEESIINDKHKGHYVKYLVLKVFLG